MNNINLARKWRPKSFESIIGQDLSVSMLKNSLYLKTIFPVYLFSGQRGCGKTSTARVFASAINCKKLIDFQVNPKEQFIPCLQCSSCKSMLKSNHPDFIEMDAASHTGVDNVRQIIESCSYMPLAGSKKIYLIDEAHMLSKAAFNAFLKILEEPPTSVSFILATTEIQKIPDTVRSRCFQVLFHPVQTSTLQKYLKQICKNENIPIDDDAIQLLTQETEGSVRDALNLLEQIRFTGEKITKEIVIKVLGKIGERQLFTLFDLIIDQKPKELLEHLKLINFESLLPQNIWNMIIQLCKSILWIKYEVKNESIMHNNLSALEALSKKCSLNRLYALMQLLWSQESIFLRTPQKHLFLENVLLQMCHQVNLEDLQELINQSTSQYKNNPENNNNNSSSNNNSNSNSSITSIKKTNANSNTNKEKNNCSNPKWQNFLQKITTTNDPLLASIFKQTQFIGENKEKALVSICLNNNSSFFIDKINECKLMWVNVLKEIFPNTHGFDFIKTDTKFTSNYKPPSLPKIEISSYSQKIQSIPTAYNNKSLGPQGTSIDVSNIEKWPKVHLITQYFSGKIEKAINN